MPSSQDFPEIAAQIKPITCADPDGIITITTSKPSSIQWKSPTGTAGSGGNIVSIISGIYTIEATAANGCTSTTSYTLPIDTIRPVVAPLSSEILTCNVTSVRPSVQASQYVSWEWMGNGFVNNTELNPAFSKPGTYTLTLRNTNGCTQSIQFQIGENKRKPKIQATVDDLTCTNLESNIKITGDVNLKLAFNHSNPTLNIGTLVKAPGTITIKATNDLGCDTSLILEVKEYKDLPNIQSRPVFLNCKETQAWTSDLILDKALKYTWETKNGTVQTDSILVTSKDDLTLVAVNKYVILEMAHDIKRAREVA